VLQLCCAVLLRCVVRQERSLTLVDVQPLHRCMREKVVQQWC
jgi:hypothetical protein